MQQVNDPDGFSYERPVTFCGGGWFSSGPVHIGDNGDVGTEFRLHVVVVGQAKAAELDQVHGTHRESSLPGARLGTKYVKRNATINC